jgi:hypothetical protein
VTSARKNQAPFMQHAPEKKFTAIVAAYKIKPTICRIWSKVLVSTAVILNCNERINSFVRR